MRAAPCPSYRADSSQGLVHLGKQHDGEAWSEQAGVREGEGERGWERLREPLLA